MRVDIVYANVSTRAQIGIDIFGLVLFLLPATTIMAYLSWPIFANSWAQGEISANAGGLLRWPVKIFLPLGFALITLQGLSELDQARRHADRPHEGEPALRAPAPVTAR